MNEVQKTRLDRIIKGHEKIAGAITLALDEAIKVGGDLEAQKAETAHGEWETWMEKTLPFDPRTARRYMRAYRNREQIKTASVSGLTAAYRLLEEPKVVTDTSKYATLSHAECCLEIDRLVRKIKDQINLDRLNANDVVDDFVEAWPHPEIQRRLGETYWEKQEGQEIDMDGLSTHSAYSHRLWDATILILLYRTDKEALRKLLEREESRRTAALEDELYELRMKDIKSRRKR